jgi:hypothetical protein
VNEISDSDVHGKEEESNQILWDEMERALLEELEAEPQVIF